MQRRSRLENDRPRHLAARQQRAKARPATRPRQTAAAARHRRRSSAGALRLPCRTLNSDQSTCGASAFSHACMCSANTGEEPNRSSAMPCHCEPWPENTSTTPPARPTVFSLTELQLPRRPCVLLGRMRGSPGEPASTIHSGGPWKSSSRKDNEPQNIPQYSGDFYIQHQFLRPHNERPAYHTYVPLDPKCFYLLGRYSRSASATCQLNSRERDGGEGKPVAHEPAA